MNLLGVFHSYSDPSAALVRDGRLVAFVEEERLLRVKHAEGQFPSRAVRFVLDAADVRLNDVDAIVQAWDCAAYEDGRMAAHFDRVNATYPTTDADRGYQQRHLSNLNSTTQRGIIERHLRKEFGGEKFPPIEFVSHHLAHACLAYQHSAYPQALVLTVDGSGEWVTNGWWLGKDGKLDLLHEVHIPHSLGWFYSAFTEYLGFSAYDGEYKVMGLAAYGKEAPELAEKLERMIWYDGAGGFASDPMLMSRGEHSYSYYHNDALVDLFGRAPRARADEIEPWHMNLAYEVQRRLESIVLDMLKHWVDKTGVRRLVVAGGVGLNVKMNGRLLTSGLVDEIFPHPLCSDTGISIGAGLAYAYLSNGGLKREDRLRDLYLGPAYTDEEIEAVLSACKLRYSKEASIEARVADLLAEGKVVGWFQGGMEGGPRALGARSILADPRHIESRDKVNAVIKFREFWRPFCPSMTSEGAARYLAACTSAPFMVLAVPATPAAEKQIPAAVHVDGSSRPQIVDQDTNPRFHRLLCEFEERTGVPCVLNTSFNIKGEPIVCTPHDAIRTFSATGLDALAIGSYLLQKED